jgi:hypothetical protein
MDRSICQGSLADLTRLVDTLSSAFQNDPALSWILPDPAQRRLRLPKLFDIIVRSDLAAGSGDRNRARPLRFGVRRRRRSTREQAVRVTSWFISVEQGG